jgi:parallel beta-helix repeat protein
MSPRRLHRIGALALAILGAAMAAPAATRYVKHDATGANNGTSWDNAYTTLQPAIAAATSGDEVWVAAGTYNPTSWPNGGSTDREMHFSLKNGVAVYGGFAGTETLLTERDPANNPVILSGDIGIQDDTEDNCYHVFYHPSGLNLDVTAVIDGFTLADGRSNGSSPHDSGGCFYNDSSSPTVINCTFSYNMNYNAKGGCIYNLTSSPAITNCTFNNNNGGSGGCIYNDASSPAITNCTFSTNSATSQGGAIYNSTTSAPVIINGTFAGNTASGGGHGIYGGSASLKVKNCILYYGATPQLAGFTGTPTVSYCIIAGGFAGGTDIITGDPDLPALADDGGPTMTIAIPVDSIAMAIPESAGGGNWNGCPDTDQRGFHRPNSGFRAIGTYQPGAGKPALRTSWQQQFIPEAGPDVSVFFIDQGNGYTVVSKGLCWSTGNNPTVADAHVECGTGATDFIGTVTGLAPFTVYYVRPYAQLDDGSCVYGNYVKFRSHRRAYVVSGGAGTMDGSSWANAYANPQVAFENATEVWVAAGTYKPTSWPTGGSTAREMHFCLETGVAAYGGFVGTENLLSQRDIAANPTIFSGDIGAAGNTSDNCYHVFCQNESYVFDLPLDWIAALDGFTIKDGNANGCTGYSHRHTCDASGGGMLNVSYCTMVIANCTFTGNLGGGMQNSTPALFTITNCTFSGNSGAGMINDSLFSSVTNKVHAITNCAFSGNTISGMSNENSSPTVTNCTFSGNGSSSTHGGGMLNDFRSSPTVTNCTFSGNSASTSGKGIYGYSSSSPIVKNCIFWGGGDQIAGGTPTVSYCVVDGGFAGGTDIITDDPQLGPLADNGGPTMTCAIPADSSAVAIPKSAGGDWNGCPDLDQRGSPRPNPGLRAIGAYEPDAYVLTYLAGAHGAIAGINPQTVAAGTDGTPVTPTPDIGSHFVDWSDTSIANPRQDTSVSGDLTVTANFAVNVYALAYHAGANGAIAGAAAQTVFHGSDGTPVTPEPDEGYHWVEWSDGSTANPRQDTGVTGDIEVTATFSINVYTLTYLAGAGGSVTGQATQTATHGADGSEVVATPDVGRHFVQWSDGVLAAARTDLDITANLTVTAQFAIDTFSVIFHAGANGSLTGASSQTVEYSADATSVTANPDINHHFVDWTVNSGAGNGAINTGTNPLLITDVIGPIEVTANFAINTYTVTFQTDGTAGATLNGSTLVTDTVDHGGTTDEVSATAPAGLSFLGWTGDHVGGENPLTVANVTADMTVTAHFGNLLAQGATFAILAGDVGVGEFTAKPKVYAVYANPVSGKVGQKASAKVLIKINANNPADTVDCEWTKKIKLFSAKNFVAAQKAGETADQWLGLAVNQQPLLMALHVGSKQADPVDRIIHSMQLMPPIIANIVDGGQDAKGNDLLVITGTWFGTKKPKVWREYEVNDGAGGTIIKHQAMKVLKPTEADALAGFVDSKGKPAYMNPATGASKAVVIIPTKEPNGVLNGTIVLENGVGLAAGSLD